MSYNRPPFTSEECSREDHGARARRSARLAPNASPRVAATPAEACDDVTLAEEAISPSIMPPHTRRGQRVGLAQRCAGDEVPAPRG